MRCIASHENTTTSNSKELRLAHLLVVRHAVVRLIHHGIVVVLQHFGALDAAEARFVERLHPLLLNDFDLP